MSSLPTRTVGCTIVARNYLPYARVAAEGWWRFHLGDPFYVLVSEMDAGVPLDEEFEAVSPTDIGVLARLAMELGRAFGREPVVEPSGRFRVGDVHAAVADISRARAAIGYEPLVGIEDGLRTLVAEVEAAEATDRLEAVERELRRQGILRGWP